MLDAPAAPSTRFASDLNEPQARAVAHGDGPLLVFAGAGSGKTRVITYRVASLLAERGVPPYRILAVTFTNKAAGEMRGRIERLVGEDVARDLWVGTFHATCARMLRRYAETFGRTRDFVIYDDADQKAVVARVVKELGLDEREYPPRALLWRIGAAKQRAEAPADVAGADRSSRPGDRVFLSVYERYEDYLRACNAVDFEDLLLCVMRVAESESDAGAELRGRFRHVLVDEFQDTNHVQYRLVRAFAAPHRNLCVVGDDDQSIYGWRGADVRNIRRFRADFPDAEVVKLEQNYRSSARIVRAALGVIRPSREREPKELWTANAEGDPVSVYAASDERDEAAFAVARVREAVGRGVPAERVAVFYRIHAQSRVLEEAMRAENVPYQIVGGLKFFDRAEVKDGLAYLRLLVNPRSDVDLLRIVNVPARGIGATTVERLAALAAARGTSLYEALGPAEEAADLGKAARGKVAAFRALLRGLIDAAGSMPPSAMAQHVLEATGYEKALRDQDTAEADARLENLRELVGSLADYEEEAAAAGEEPTLRGYLERTALVADADTLRDAPRVPLMTVHAAKGLEFHTVVLTGMEDGLFPYRGLDADRDRDVDEERRLAYVALTRARERLFVSHADTRSIFGQTRYNMPSRFLDDLPDDGGAPARPRPRSAPRASVPFPRDRWVPSPRADTRRPGERYVEPDAAHVVPGPAAGAFARGARVRHERFGTGEVRRVEATGDEPIVVAYFRGWGEKKVLARYLEPSG